MIILLYVCRYIYSIYSHTVDFCVLITRCLESWFIYRSSVWVLSAYPGVSVSPSVPLVDSSVGCFPHEHVERLMQKQIITCGPSILLHLCLVSAAPEAESAAQRMTPLSVQCILSMGDQPSPAWLVGRTPCALRQGVIQSQESEGKQKCSPSAEGPQDLFSMAGS